MDSSLQKNGYEPFDFRDLTPYRLDTLDIARGMPVEALNGRAGFVSEVVFDVSAGRATHLLVMKGNGLSRDALVPVEWISELDNGRILLAVRLEQVDAFAERPSEYLEMEDESPAA